MAGRAFIFGLGFTGGRFAQDLSRSGFQVAGCSRSGECAGVDDVYAYGPSAPLPTNLAALTEATHILLSIPPGDAGDPVLLDFAAVLAQNKRLQWIGYLSTTGVYGDRAGGEVDEESALRPTSARSRRRVEAEARWLDFGSQSGAPVHIFRLAGIYGPGRNALLQAKAEATRRIIKPGHRFSRIHVDDLVAVLRASMASPRAGAIYNVCDDLAAESADVMIYAANLANIPPPPAIAFADAGLSPMAQSFYADNKTVSNALIKQELGVTLRYPTYREGLTALWADYSAG